MLQKLTFGVSVKGHAKEHHLIENSATQTAEAGEIIYNRQNVSVLCTVTCCFVCNVFYHRLLWYFVMYSVNLPVLDLVYYTACPSTDIGLVHGFSLVLFHLLNSQDPFVRLFLVDL